MTTNLLKLRSSQPESLKAMIQTALNHRLQDLESGLQQTQARLKQFETEYHWSTEQFVELFTNELSFLIFSWNTRSPHAFFPIFFLLPTPLKII